MARTYAQEKEYCTQRAQELTAEMEAALEAGDAERFKAAYGSSFRYMTRQQRKPLYIRFLQMQTGRE